MYEGHSINKLQNDTILLIFKIQKFGNIRFVGNLIGDIYWNFYDDDIIIVTVTSLVVRAQSVSAVFCPLCIVSYEAGFSYNSPSVKQRCDLQGKRTVSVSKRV